jgi:hypothetical protein
LVVNVKNYELNKKKMKRGEDEEEEKKKKSQVSCFIFNF